MDESILDKKFGEVTIAELYGFLNECLQMAKGQNVAMKKDPFEGSPSIVYIRDFVETKSTENKQIAGRVCKCLYRYARYYQDYLNGFDDPYDYYEGKGAYSKISKNVRIDLSNISRRLLEKVVAKRSFGLRDMDMAEIERLLAGEGLELLP